ncbi:MAG: NGG1p interacting factor NIF3 [Candidatus Omnitrophica bacterium]|nr:NGG1p interacting factor NIF3 [Candidatus Omnitrophota bacterium]
MKLKDFYSFCVQEGIKADLRTKVQLRETFRQQRKKIKVAKTDGRKFFDKEDLRNPYADTRILYGDVSKEIKRILVGIDIDPAEILLAERLSQKGKVIDLVLAHHPEGHAWAGFYEVMSLQTDLLVNLGLEKKVAEDLMSKRIGDVNRRVHGSNHMRTVDAAKLLDMALMCCHTPADNHVASYLQNLMETVNPKTLKDAVRLLMKEPEYQSASTGKAGPKIVLGKPEDKVGKVFVDMTGGTEGSKDIFARLSQAGVKTLVCMHLSEEHFKKIQCEYLNVIVAGHIASDNLGMNLLLDKIEKKSSLEVLECSGFRRFKR